MSTSWLKKRFNTLRRFSGLRRSKKSLPDNDTSQSTDCLRSSIKNDLDFERTHCRWDRDGKNANRDYAKCKDRYLVDRNTYDPRTIEPKVCNVNVCRLANVSEIVVDDDESECPLVFFSDNTMKNVFANFEVMLAGYITSKLAFN